MAFKEGVIVALIGGLFALMAAVISSYKFNLGELEIVDIYTRSISPNIVEIDVRVLNKSKEFAHIGIVKLEVEEIMFSDLNVKSPLDVSSSKGVNISYLNNKDDVIEVRSALYIKPEEMDRFLLVLYRRPIGDDFKWINYLLRISFKSGASKVIPFHIVG